MVDENPMAPDEAPPAAGVRLMWSDLPDDLRAEVEDWLGGRIVSAETQASGFSPGIASRIVIEDGRRVFVKAAGPTPNPATPNMRRREARIVESLPRSAPVPRLLWSHDEGDGGWVVQGGPRPVELFARHPRAVMADPDAVTAVVATFAGYFTCQSRQPPPPGLPTVRVFQAAQGVVARQWLAERTGWR